MRAAEEVFTAVKGNGPLVLKAPYGSAGRELRRVAGAADLTPALRGWIRNLLETQGGIVVEPWLDKQRDLSMQMEVRSDGTVELLGAREFLADARGRYRGAILGRGFWRLAPEERRFVDAIMPAWLDLARAAGAALGAGGYRGPAGIDAMLYRTPDGALRFKPLGELNPRWTMGRVALALERHVAPDARAAWCIARREDLDAAALAASHPAHFHDAANGRRISRGIFFTTDPERAKRVVTALAVGAAALGALIRSDPDRVSGSR
jgi:hypothetical protein